MDLMKNIAKADRLLAGEGSKDPQVIMESVQELIYYPVLENPSVPGLADALFMSAAVQQNTGLYHLAAANNMLAWRFRASLLNKRAKQTIVVNLAQNHLQQKSYEEAYHMGRFAEQLEKQPHCDLLGILAESCFFTKRFEKCRQYLKELKQVDPEAFSYAMSRLNGQGILLTLHEDCSDLLSSLQALPQGSSAEELNEIVLELLEKPDGKDAWKCWQFQVETLMPGTDPGSPFAPMKDQFAAMQASALVLNSLGKVISFHPDHAKSLSVDWVQYAQGLAQMCFYELSERYFLGALKLDLTNENQRHARAGLDYARTMAGYSENDGRRPDSRDYWEKMVLSRAGRS